MSKNKSKTENTALEQAPELARYHAAVEAAAATKAPLAAAKASPANSQTLDTAGGKVARVTLLEADAADHRAKAELEQAALDLDGVLHAQELAQGDVDAIAIDARRAAADIRAALDDKRRAEAAATEATQRAVARFAESAEAHQRLTARRIEAGLPPPARPPLGSHHEPLEKRCEQLEAFAETGPELKSDKLRIHRLEKEATELRAMLRRAELEAEKKKEAEAEYDRQREAAQKAQRELDAKKHAEEQAAYDARLAEEKRLADEHRAREQSRTAG